MRRLFLDIETSPHITFRWEKGSKPAFMSEDQLIEPSRMLCVGWAFAGDREVTVRSEWSGGRRIMLQKVRDAIDEADVIVHYNGALFDVPHLNREFIEHGIAPPSPFLTVDLWRAVKSQFALPSNRLSYVVNWLNIGQKASTGGFALWRDIMLGAGSYGDPKSVKGRAQHKMERYCKQDVALLPLVYDKLLPLIPGLPNAGLFEPDGEKRCPACGSTNVKKNGFAYTTAGRFQQYRCGGCGKHSRDYQRSSTTPLRRVD